MSIRSVGASSSSYQDFSDRTQNPNDLLKALAKVFGCLSYEDLYVINQTGKLWHTVVNTLWENIHRYEFCMFPETYQSKWKEFTVRKIQRIEQVGKQVTEAQNKLNATINTLEQLEQEEKSINASAHEMQQSGQRDKLESLKKRLTTISEQIPPLRDVLERDKQQLDYLQKQAYKLHLGRNLWKQRFTSQSFCHD